MTIRKRRWLVIGAALVVSTSAVALSLALAPGSEANTAGPSAVAAAEARLGQTAPSALSDARADEIETAFNSRDPDAIRQVIVPADAELADEIAAEALPDGSMLSIDTSSFVLIDDRRATVDADISGEIELAFQLLLVWDGGAWRFSNSVER